jgi:hypothetical protein
MVKEVKMSNNANNVKAMVVLFRCIKWGQVCTKKCKNAVINVRGKGKLLNKMINVVVVVLKK